MAHKQLIGLCFIAAGVALAACQGKDQSQQASPKEPLALIAHDASVHEIELIREGMKSILRDSDSAKFKDVTLKSNDGFFCGEVNATNGFGGYVGYKTFDGSFIVDRETQRARAAIIRRVNDTYPAAGLLYASCYQ
jgi:hypothetical protein